MNTDRNASFKKLKIEYRTEIPDDLFHNYCMKYRVDRNTGIKQLKEAAIQAAEVEINNQLTEVRDEAFQRFVEKEILNNG
tara:strand:- start:1664 stop:1903 length:240 start_codon:yes stop_codon:yes gene_type:complete